MTDRYTIRWENAYGIDSETYTNLDDALAEFLSCHSDGVKVQLTADAPAEDNTNEWDF